MPPYESFLALTTSVFLAVRPRLFGIAYRVLGSVADAEEIVQETWLRWRRTDPARIAEPALFLTTVATRLAVDSARSARLLRAAYVGPWLPEPVDTAADPGLGAERPAAIDPAVLVLLEKLDPVERAAYVLREAFGCPYQQIAHILRTCAAGARRLVRLAREQLSGYQPDPKRGDP